MAILLMSLAVVSAEQGGVNEEADLQGTIILDLDYPTSVNATDEDGGVMRLIAELEPDQNLTSISWVTQICVNSGVCYPPVYNMMVQDNSTWSGEVPVDHDASYLNWRFDLQFEDRDEAQRVPETGFGWKVWSTCWFDGDQWGGIDYDMSSQTCSSVGSTDADLNDSESSFSLPFTGALFTLICMAMGAVWFERQ